jgi:hypothetical protein
MNYQYEHCQEAEKFIAKLYDLKVGKLDYDIYSCQILDLFIDYSSRNNGVGSELLRKAEQE